MKSRLSILIAAIALALPMAAFAANKQAATSNAGGAQEADADKVLATLHKINLEEIDMGKMAHDQGHSQAVKDYADRLVTDHNTNDDKVQALAKQLAVKLPDKDELMSDKDHAAMKTLKAKKGAAFDKAFAQAMAKDHAAAAKSLEDAQSKVTGPVAQLVSETLPVIREHEKLAQKIASSGEAALANTKAKAKTATE